MGLANDVLPRKRCSSKKMYFCINILNVAVEYEGKTYHQLRRIESYIRYMYHVIDNLYPKKGTAGYCYNVVQNNMTLHTSVHWMGQNIDQSLNSQKTCHSSPVRSSYKVSFMRIFLKTDRVMTAPHCICECSVWGRYMYHSLTVSACIWILVLWMNVY